MSLWTIRSGYAASCALGTLMFLGFTAQDRPVQAQSGELLGTPDPIALAGAGQPPEESIRKLVHPSTHRVTRDWYETRGLLPASPVPKGSPNVRSSLGAVPGGQKIEPTERGAYSERRSQWLPGSYQLDLIDLPNLEPRGITLRNVGDGNIINPWITVNGVGNWYNTASISQEILNGEREAEAAALKIWEFLRANRYHWEPVTEDVEVHSPAKFLNVWGYGLCDDSANNMECLAKASGLNTTRVWGLNGHVVAEAYYNGAWHMFDPDMEVFAPLKGTNKGQASVAQITGDPDLNTRVGAGIVSPFYASVSDNSTYQGWWDSTRTMAMTLRPGESLSRRFGNWGKYAAFTFPNSPEPPLYGNGQQVWEGDFSIQSRRTGLKSVSGGQWTSIEPYLRLGSVQQPLKAVAEIQSAYAVVGGKVEVETVLGENGTLILRGKRSGDTSSSEILRVHGPFRGWVKANLDGVVGRIGKRPVYGVEVELELLDSGSSSSALLGPGRVPVFSGISQVRIEGDIQLAPAALPRLLAGRVNTVNTSFAIQSGGELEIELDWDIPYPGVTANSQKSGLVSREAHADLDTIQPLDGEIGVGLTPTLAWTGGVVDDGVDGWRSIRITYDAEGRKPVSPVLMPRGVMGSQFAVPSGWLLSNTPYYWQVSEGNNREPGSRMFNFSTSPASGDQASVSEWFLYGDR